MVEDTGAAASAGAVLPLNAPEPVGVEADAKGYPAVLIRRGARLVVASVEDVWRIEDEWWRGSPVARTYFEVLTDDGRRVALFFDHARQRWFTQRA